MTALMQTGKRARNSAWLECLAFRASRPGCRPSDGKSRGNQKVVGSGSSPDFDGEAAQKSHRARFSSMTLWARARCFAASRQKRSNSFGVEAPTGPASRFSVSWPDLPMVFNSTPRRASMVSRLAELFTEAVKNTCQGEIAILFSGGLDSAAIATVARQYAHPLLITAGIEGSSDLEAARKIAAELGLEHKEVVLTEEEIIKIYKKSYKIRRGDMLKVELMVPVFSCCREAARAGKWRIDTGSGAEEL